MITGVEISKVEAERIASDLVTNIKFNINFEDVEVKGEDVSVAFKFTADYETGDAAKPKPLGKLEISGKVASKEEKKDTDEIAKKWKESKTLPISFAEGVITILNYECGVRGTLLSSSIGLLAPLALSKVKLQENPQNAKK